MVVTFRGILTTSYPFGIINCLGSVFKIVLTSLYFRDSTDSLRQAKSL